MSSPYPTAHKKRLGALLARARERSGMTAIALAKELEVSRQQVYDWERAASVPDASRFSRIEKVYSLPEGAIQSALLAAAGESMAYWRGRIDEAREAASELVSRLAALSAEMQGDNEDDYRHLITQIDSTPPATTSAKTAE